MIAGIINKSENKEALAPFEEGFTILELMIATTVLSIILLLATIIMISVGHLYSKGINESLLQDNTRNTVDEVAQNLEVNDVFSSAPTPGPNGELAYCIGGVRYTYIFGRQIGTDASKNQINHVLWRDIAPASCAALNLSSATPSSGGTELIAPRSRLVLFSITRTTASDPYTVKIRAAYGDDDLLCSPSVPGDCSARTTSTSLTNNDLICKGTAGSQFCAIAKLETTVVQRLK